MAAGVDRLPDFDWDRCEEGSELPNRDRVDAMAERLAHVADLIAPITKQIEDLVAEGRAPTKAAFASPPSVAEISSKLQRNNSSSRGSNVWQRTRQNSSANLDHDDDDNSTTSITSSKGSVKSMKKEASRPPPFQFPLDVSDLDDKIDGNMANSTLRQTSAASKGTNKAKDIGDRPMSLILESGSLVSQALEISGNSDGSETAASSLGRESALSMLPLDLNPFCLPRWRRDGVGDISKVKKRGEPIFKEPISEAKQGEAGYCMADPRNRYRIFWDVGIVFPLLCYIVISMPFRAGFSNEPPGASFEQQFEALVDLAFVFDIFLNFRTGYILDAEAKLVEFNFGRVARRYSTTWLPLDVVSAIPFSVLDFAVASTNSSPSFLKAIKGGKILRTLRFLKMGRVFKAGKIWRSLSADMKDKISDMVAHGNTQHFLVILGLILRTMFFCHLLSCIWVAVGRSGAKRGDLNWLTADSSKQGPFKPEDTEGGDRVWSVYLAAFYFTVTTIMSVGYGDVIVQNTDERMLVVFIELFGSFMFAMIVASLTSVVSSQDMNASATGQQLDAVKSFVRNRRIPPDLGRRIRRHFRNYFEIKPAIDESRILSELSTGLRKEVSAFLVNEAMAHAELFRSIPEVLWPKLLPSVRPLRVVAGETICRQGEVCREAFVILQGKVAAFWWPELSRSTFIEESLEKEDCVLGPGDTLNVKCVLNLDSTATETAVALTMCDIYAIHENDFSAMFVSESEISMLETMREHEAYSGTRRQKNETAKWEKEEQKSKEQKAPGDGAEKIVWNYD